VKDNCCNQILAKYYVKKFTGIDKRIIFVSDKFYNYKNAFNKLFYRIAKLQFGVPIKCNRYGLKYNNNAIERYNGKLKDRIKSIRSGFKNFDDARFFMDLRRIIHNFVNPHQELGGKTPAEIAEIILPLKRNKLLNLIRFVGDNRITII